MNIKYILLISLLFISNSFATIDYNQENEIDPLATKFKNFNYLDDKIKEFMKYHAGTAHIDLAYKELKKVLSDKETLLKIKNLDITEPQLYWDFKDYTNLKGYYRKIWLYIDHLHFEQYKGLMQHNYLKYKNVQRFNKTLEKTLYNILLEIQKEDDLLKPKVTKKELTNIKIIIAFDKFTEYEKEHNHINYISNPIAYNYYKQIKDYFYLAQNYFKYNKKFNDKYLYISAYKISQFLIKYNLLYKFKQFYTLYLEKKLQNYQYKKYYYFRY